MTCNLKALGLVLVAVLALSAVAASAASANKQGFLTTEKGNAVTLDGVESGPNTIGDPGGETFDCPGSTTVGHRINVTPHELIPNKSTEVTITPNLASCFTASGAHKSTMTMNGCDFVFTIGQTTTETTHSPYQLTEHIVCPEGKKIEVHVYFAENNENLSICTFTISPQTVNGFDISNAVKEGTTLDTLNATGEANIVGERHGACGKTELYNTKQTINYKFSGTSAAGASEGITITD